MGALFPRTLMWINRIWIFTLADGTPAIDWGEGMAQELVSGKFVYVPGTRGHALLDDELDALRAAGHIAQFTETQVALYAWASE